MIEPKKAPPLIHPSVTAAVAPLWADCKALPAEDGAFSGRGPDCPRASGIKPEGSKLVIVFTIRRTGYKPIPTT